MDPTPPIVHTYRHNTPQGSHASITVPAPCWITRRGYQAVVRHKRLHPRLTWPKYPTPTSSEITLRAVVTLNIFPFVMLSFALRGRIMLQPKAVCGGD